MQKKIIPTAEAKYAEEGQKPATNNNEHMTAQASSPLVRCTVSDSPLVACPLTPSSPQFDSERLDDCVAAANAVTMTYGVSIISINVVAAVPADRDLMKSLAQGAVAAAEAQKFETVAIGRASANKIEARGEAEAAVIRANGLAESEKIRADGLKAAADTLSANPHAVQVSLIDKTGAALNDKTSFFFGGDAKDMSGLLAPALTAAAAGMAHA